MVLALSKYLTGVSNRSDNFRLLPCKKKCSLLSLFRKAKLTKPRESVGRLVSLAHLRVKTRALGGAGRAQAAMAAQPGLLRLPRLSASGPRTAREGRWQLARPSVRLSAKAAPRAPEAAPVRRSGTLSPDGAVEPALGAQPRAVRDLPPWGRRGGQRSLLPRAAPRPRLRAERGDTGCAGTRWGIPVRGGGTRAGCLLSPSFFARSPPCLSQESCGSRRRQKPWQRRDD